MRGGLDSEGAGVMQALKRCWWCGRQAMVDTELDLKLDECARRGIVLIRDDSTFDGSSESWICTDQSKCIRRSLQELAL